MTREADYLRAIGWDNADALTGQDLFDAMVGVSLRHAERLRQLGPVGVLALDPCPRCGGTVIASDTEARCVTGCKWRYRPGRPRAARVATGRRMILGLLILALFFSCLVAMLYDVDCAIEDAEHEALLDRMWDDEAA